MAFWILLAGLVLATGGVVITGLADAWLSRSILVYLDAVEHNVSKVVEALRAGATNLKITGIDVKRDRAQNRARALKTVGWLVMASGFALQLVAACLARFHQ
jgi:hypothetical protein